MKLIPTLAVACLCIAAVPAQAADANAELMEIVRLAKTEYPQLATVEAIHAVAERRASGADAVFKNIGELANVVADHYSLYERVHTETYADYCRGKGVDLAPYAREFKRRHQAEAEAAEVIYTRLRTDYAPVWSMIKDEVGTHTETGLGQIAQRLEVAPAQVCDRLAQAPEASLQVLSYAASFADRDLLLLSFRH